VDYVTKPFQFEEIYARVAIHLELRRLQAELQTHNLQLEERVRQRTQQLTEANKRLAVLDQAKGDFLTVISHELRTPLNGIFGLAELAFDECPSNPTMDDCRKLFGESRERLLAIVDDALLLSQIGVAGDRFAPQPVALNPILAAARERVSGFAASRKVTLAPAPDLPALWPARRNCSPRPCTPCWKQ